MLKVKIVSENGDAKSMTGYVNPRNVLYCTEAGDNTCIHMIGNQVIYVEDDVIHISLKLAQAAEKNM